jgi:hypothetical protein
MLSFIYKGKCSCCDVIIANCDMNVKILCLSGLPCYGVIYFKVLSDVNDKMLCWISCTELILCG